MTTQRQALEAALSVLESERIMAADAQGNYTVEVTPKRIIDAIEKVKAALAEPEQEPAGYAVFAWGRLENTYRTRSGADLFRAACPENAYASVAPLYTSPQPSMAFTSLSTCIKAADHLNKENDKELIGVGARLVCFAPVHGERT